MKRTNDQRHATAKRNALYTALNRQTARDLKRYMAQNTTRNGRRQTTLVFDGDSTCFDQAMWRSDGQGSGSLFLRFARDGYNEVVEGVSRQEGQDFLNSGSLGRTYNDLYR
jgi:hypothetical protein